MHTPTYTQSINQANTQSTIQALIHSLIHNPQLPLPPTLPQYPLRPRPPLLPAMLAQMPALNLLLAGTQHPFVLRLLLGAGVEAAVDGRV